MTQSEEIGGHLLIPNIRSFRFTTVQCCFPKCLWL